MHTTALPVGTASRQSLCPRRCRTQLPVLGTAGHNLVTWRSHGPSPAKVLPRGSLTVRRVTVQQGEVSKEAKGGSEARSEAEMFIESFGKELAEEEAPAAVASRLQKQYSHLQEEAGNLSHDIDALYSETFGGMTITLPGEGAGEGEEAPQQELHFDDMSEQRFGELGRTQPKALQALLSAREESDATGWQQFQARLHQLKLKRMRVEQEATALGDAINAQERERAMLVAQQAAEAEADTAEAAAAAGAEPGKPSLRRGGKTGTVRIVLITGFESFNQSLYTKVAKELARRVPFVRLSVFSDRDLSGEGRPRVEAALKGADVFFGSLLFDYDQVEWLKERLASIPVRLVFESALELMSSTSVGSFQMGDGGGGGEKRGPPPVVKKVLSLFGASREEDRMVGYLSFLKVGPKLLKFVPGNKARDLRNWLTVYSYWNQGGLDNVVAMFLYLVENYFGGTGFALPRLVETPATGCLHPDHEGYFASPVEYMRWYRREGKLRDTDAPVVAVLLYRKHVITSQPYIPQLVHQLEADGVIPIPIFINGVEAHTVVRDLLTTPHEQELLRSRSISQGSLRADATLVDAVVSTIGFPLVGGPAGTMEGGRQSEVARQILGSKGVPYVVAAPLLIQDMDSWSRTGVAGLQSVVLYSLPELDGAIDTVPLGGLVGDNIYLVPERASRLARRLRKWVDLRRKPPSEVKIAVLMYGFPPGVGATGTAALLNVPKSLESLLRRLKSAGYDLGDVDMDALDGEALVTALKGQEDQRMIVRGASAVAAHGAGATAEFGVEAAAAEVTPSRLKEMLSFPPEWGPTEWGPFPYLPDHDVLVRRMENQWGDLRAYKGLMTTSRGNLLVDGLQLGNVFVGVQPMLGIEGDPMRLLFERDLTPHPQYTAFYKWLQNEYKADVVVHMGMHGTVEWLPGSPLGNTGTSWSDVLLGDLPNVYIYACNNPSESIIAKRRGYGTIVSYNVPPYGRAGLYKQLASLKELLQEYRDSPETSDALKAPIIELLNAAGLQEDCPFEAPPPGGQEEGDKGRFLRAEDADSVEMPVFKEYAARLYQYLQLVECRLFSEGLHVLGSPPSPTQMGQYLSAYFGEDLPEEAVAAVSEEGAGNLATVRAALEKQYRSSSAPGASPFDASTGLASWSPKLEEAVRIRDLLERNTEELDGVMTAIKGGYVLPEAGGDLLRDGAGVLPTGRNIHALDPYRMPSIAAMERGSAAAEAILAHHRESNDGEYPETVAVNLWGLDAIKTKGETVAMALYLVGAKPVKEGTGRIARFDLLPLEEMGGRPRVDVLCNMSGIFRDSFQNVVELLDDLFQRAADVDEPPEKNFLRKHAQSLREQGVANAAARLFSNPAGDYGSMVNERVGQGTWENGQELGDTWASRNAYSYGRGAERGAARPEVLQQLLATTDRVVQEIDSVEYGLTDIQEYYANTGALKKAAETARTATGRGGRVGCSIVESFGKEVRPRELEDVLRLEYRSKLLNPRWAEAMAAQGSGGAFEISQRMTAAVGWGATVNFQEDWVWDQAAETYAMDTEMADKLRAANPQAFSNVLKRMIEANGRGMWKAKPEMLAKLRSLYGDMDDQLEGVL